MLARHEQALQLSVLDHLREIEARRLYLRLGYSSLFDYTVRELHYTEAAAWRRIKAMRLCRETRGVRERLQDGSLNLSNAALLQNSFERWDRRRRRSDRRRIGGSRTGRRRIGAAGTSAAPRAGSAPAAAPGKAAGAPVPVLDAHARQQLVERAMGKSTRQVQQMLAEVDPEAAVPAERLRALGDGRWELKAVVDAECQRGLQQLRELLSHVDPHLTFGQLVGRLVREGVERYDPSRPPRRKRRKSDPAGDECSAETAGRETADRVAAAAAAENPRRAEKSAAPTASPSAPKRSAKPTAVGTSPAVLPAGGGSGEASSKRRPRAAAGQPYFGAEVRCAAGRARRRAQTARWRQSRLRRRSPACQPAVRFGAERRRRRIGGRTSTAKRPAVGLRFAAAGQDWRRGIRQRSLGWRRRLDSGSQCGGAGSASRPSAAKSGRSIPAAVKREVWRRDSGLLQLRRPAYREALRLTLLPGAGPHRAGRAGRRRGAGKLEAPLCGSPPLPARSSAALGSAGLGEVSAVAAPERAPRSRSIRRIAATRDTSPGGRAAGAECRPRS